jgi:hypothetical protein
MTFVPVETLEQVVEVALSNGQAPRLSGPEVAQPTVTG